MSSRVVLARENSLDDLRAIRDAVPKLGLEAFVHGALCISYSGQCLMSGMISERSANRGACAQACRKDYTLTDAATGATLDTGYLISAKDLAAYDELGALAAAGIRCLKIEGRKKRPEYVATVTHGYREWLDALARGDRRARHVRSRGRATRTDLQPRIHLESAAWARRTQTSSPAIARTTAARCSAPWSATSGGEIVVEVSREIHAGDGLAFDLPGSRGPVAP